MMGLLMVLPLVLFISEGGCEEGNLWAAHILGGPGVAQLLATSHGFQIIRKSNVDDNIYIMKRDTNPLVMKRKYGKLEDREEVSWAEELVPRERQKRGMFSWLNSRYTRIFNDHLWGKEWYMQDYREGAPIPVLDLNVVPCYAENITGAGVKVTVIDDGLEKDHLDIAPNYDPSISYDFNDNDTDPTPRYDDWGTNSHGTKCAGEIAMVANNRICGVGVAYNASIGGIRLLDGPSTDFLESEALTFALDKVDVYSNSWGPPDDGRTMEGPGRLTRAAFFRGTRDGRNGRGVIYIFAAGNGKGRGDNCGADGYINSIYTIAIASASQEGRTVYYGERCSAILATAYSSGAARNEMVATTNLNNTCTVRHTGTSAAAPLGAGIVVLLLQANGNLTWRDVQHLITWTSEVAPLSGNPEWRTNAAGFWVSPDFGFGLLNAHSLIKAARNWVTVPPKSICIVPIEIVGNATIYPGAVRRITFLTRGCRGMNNEVRYLEHVELRLSVEYTRRGSLSVKITSPSGLTSTMLYERFWDEARIGLSGWTMSSVHFWGEQPTGFWTITVSAKTVVTGFMLSTSGGDGILATKALARGTQHEASDDGLHRQSDEEFPDSVTSGNVKSLLAVFHGTKDQPAHYVNGPRKYAPFYL